MKIIINNPARAFTLLEVALAMGIFFVAMFSILEITSQSLRSVQMLTQNRPSPAMVISDLVVTNVLVENTQSGTFSELGMDEIYPDYAWERAVFEANTNGLFEVDVRVYSTKPNSTWQSEMSIFLYRPGSVSGLTGEARQGRGARLDSTPQTLRR